MELDLRYEAWKTKFNTQTHKKIKITPASYEHLYMHLLIVFAVL